MLGRYIPTRFCSNHAAAESTLRKLIGLTSKTPNETRPFVPINYLPKHYQPSPQVISDLKWMIQKIQLKQDFFLIGPPSRYRVHVLLMLFEMLNFEYEYILLNRDTSESDLKQRKELITSTMSSVYVDQCVVRAAINGRVLILDGVEKAERNLLPIINNLVENREMQLEDGRFLLPASRCEQLKGDLISRQMVSVHDDFRVVCIGLPTPPFRGHSLDPPFRSRFQARKVSHWPLRDQFLIAANAAPTMDDDRLARWISFVNAMATDDIQRKASQVETTEQQSSKPVNSQPPYFPIDSSLQATAIFKNCPMVIALL